MSQDSRRVVRVDRPLFMLLGYVGQVKGGVTATEVGRELLMRAIEEHPMGSQVLALIEGKLDEGQTEQDATTSE